MDELLLLTHRIPWPPNKGDKIRSHHLLRYLVKRYRVHLGTFIDDPADGRYIGQLEELCASVHVARLDPRRARIRALTGLARGTPLSLPYYRDASLRRWVRDLLQQRPISQAVVFSSPMAQYLQAYPEVPRVIDLVDVDSDKWRQYAAGKRPPARWIYAREARRLLAFERQISRDAKAVLLVSDAEAALFRELAPESAEHTHAVHNGVDTAYFDPVVAGPSPYPSGARPVVFTGAMDYWPNEDAVTWFADQVFPHVREACPEAAFYIVGSRPTPAVRALANRPGVEVTGFVDDMRPWLAHASVVVAPLRIARGVQNKVLEAMAMARPVIGSAEALAGIKATVGEEVLQADGPDALACQTITQLRAPDYGLGERARARVVDDYGWDARLRPLERLLAGVEVDDESAVAEHARMEVSHGR